MWSAYDIWKTTEPEREERQLQMHCEECGACYAVDADAKLFGERCPTCGEYALVPDPDDDDLTGF